MVGEFVFVSECVYRRVGGVYVRTYVCVCVWVPLRFAGARIYEYVLACAGVCDNVKEWGDSVQ